MQAHRAPSAGFCCPPSLRALWSVFTQRRPNYIAVLCIYADTSHLTLYCAFFVDACKINCCREGFRVTSLKRTLRRSGVMRLLGSVRPSSSLDCSCLFRFGIALWPSRGLFVRLRLLLLWL